MRYSGHPVTKAALTSFHTSVQVTGIHRLLRATTGYMPSPCRTETELLPADSGGRPWRKGGLFSVGVDIVPTHIGEAAM